MVAPIGVAPEVAPSTYEVNPGASWKPQASSQDYFSGSLASVKLANLGTGNGTSGERTVATARLWHLQVQHCGTVVVGHYWHVR